MHTKLGGGKVTWIEEGDKVFGERSRLYFPFPFNASNLQQATHTSIAAAVTTTSTSSFTAAAFAFPSLPAAAEAN